LYVPTNRCAGYATAAFVLAVLEGSTQPGVWFPEEVQKDGTKINIEMPIYKPQHPF
jgi:hypothetical protein